MRRCPLPWNTEMAAFSRYTSLATALVLLAMSVPAAAQVTINMTTAQGAGCTATTDGNGLVLAPGGTDLTATGVNLSGTGCGAVAADFEATLTVPTGGQAGNPVNVNWSAGADATRCTYGGSAGLTGWPIGTSACNGANCAGPHTVAVTPAAAGTYDLSITCTNDSGFRQGSLTASAPPDAPQPPNFALTAPATATVNTPFNVSWAVNGATSCTGSASLPTGSVSLPGWTTVTTTTSPRSVTASAAGVYTLRLTCSNAHGSTQSQNAIVTVSAGTDPSCPASPLTRLTTATIRYPNVSSSMTRPNADVTRFETIWGHATNADTEQAWPGTNGAVPAIEGWGKTQYVAAKFTVPTTVAPTAYEQLRYSTYYSGPALTMAVSQQCGDFAPVNPNCVTTGVGTGDAFKKIVLSPYTNGCPLIPGQTYYINLKMTSPLPTDCGGASTCRLATTNVVASQQ